MAVFGLAIIGFTLDLEPEVFFEPCGSRPPMFVHHKRAQLHLACLPQGFFGHGGRVPATGSSGKLAWVGHRLRDQKRLSALVVIAIAFWPIFLLTFKVQ